MSFSLCIEVNDILQYALADIAKLRILVGAHATVGVSSVYSLERISSTLIESGFTIFAYHVFPLAVEINLCGDALLPWLYVVRIHRNIFGLVGIFVGKSCKAMAKLMNHNRTMFWMVRHREVVGVEDSSATIFVGIHKHYDMLVWSASQEIV